jgi:hypothetical protein
LTGIQTEMRKSVWGSITSKYKALISAPNVLGSRGKTALGLASLTRLVSLLRRIELAESHATTVLASALSMSARTIGEDAITWTSCFLSQSSAAVGPISLSMTSSVSIRAVILETPKLMKLIIV